MADPNIARRKVKKLNIGFVATRVGETDGVSLELAKWVTVLERLGHECSFFTGESNMTGNQIFIVPEAHFKHPGIAEIYDTAFNQRVRPLETTRKIHQLKELLKEQLQRYMKKFKIELLIVENALAIPMNIPLGLAITEVIAETGIPTLAHHHDFSWERDRFMVNCISDYIAMAFPPNLPTIQHVVINTLASRQISLRIGIVAALIPNVMDFESPPPPNDDYMKSLRTDLGLSPEAHFILQPTRVIQRKGIERSIELVRMLGKQARLVISHSGGDEGNDYMTYLQEFAQVMGVEIVFAAGRIDTRRRVDAGRKVYSLSDAYAMADLVSYPSVVEGFGNAFLEAIYYRKPLVVNNYTIYSIDIKPKGFEAIEFDGFITPKVVEKVREVLTKPDIAERMTQRNFDLGKRYFSFHYLEQHLHALLQQRFGAE